MDANSGQCGRAGESEIEGRGDYSFTGANVDDTALLPLEKLNLFFVLLRGGLGFEGAKVAPFAGLRVLLPRIEAVAAGV